MSLLRGCRIFHTSQKKRCAEVFQGPKNPSVTRVDDVNNAFFSVT